MPGLNTTGMANTADYNLGRGKVFFASLDSGGLPKGFRDLGNCPEFTMSQETETLEHQSSLSGLKVTDLEIVTSQKLSVTFSLDEVNFQNLAFFLSGDTDDAIVNAAVAGFGSHQMITGAQQGTWYNLVSSTGARAYDIQDPGDVTVTGGTLDVDYTLDSKMGRIFIIVGGALSEGSNINVTLAADAGAVATLDQVAALTQTAVEGALLFISENPASDDHQTEYQFHKLSLKPEGDLSLIGDEITTLQLTGVAERNAAADADAPTLRVRTHAAA